MCGNNVTDMAQSYYNCQNLTGSPVCGPKVNVMYKTYGDCYNLTGIPVCGNNVAHMGGTYINCYNLSGGDQYWFSNKVYNVQNCFYGKNKANIYNIYAFPNTTTWNTLLINNSKSLVGDSITWTHDETNDYYYNTRYNIYIHKILPVEELLIDFEYVEENGMYNITKWKQTLNGVASTEMIIPDDPRIIL